MKTELLIDVLKDDGMINNEKDFSEPISTTENPDNQPIYIQIHHNYF